MAPRKERRQKPAETVNERERTPLVSDDGAGASAARQGRETAVRRVDGGPVTDFDPTWRGDERGEVT
jgi:hypothetical protein